MAKEKVKIVKKKMYTFKPTDRDAGKRSKIEQIEKNVGNDIDIEPLKDKEPILKGDERLTPKKAFNGNRGKMSKSDVING